MANGALSGPLLRSPALMIALLAATGWPARANDSAAELSIGGLQLIRTKDVAMASEELRIGLDRVSVRYQFVNQTSKPVALTVAFPLPDIDLSEAENIAFPSSNPVNFGEFETKIDGNAVPLTIDQRAMVGSKDVTALLRQFKLPLLPLGDPDINTARASAPALTRSCARVCVAAQRWVPRSSDTSETIALRMRSLPNWTSAQVAARRTPQCCRSGVFPTCSRRVRTGRVQSGPSG